MEWFFKKEDIKINLEDYIIKFKNLKNYTIYNYKIFNHYYTLIKDILEEKININIKVWFNMNYLYKTNN